MKNVFLGEYIKQRRLDLGLTQEQLCDGICEPMTLSRLENGKQTPSRNRINALLQRLGLPDDRYFALLSKNELEMEAHPPTHPPSTPPPPTQRQTPPRAPHPTIKKI